MQFFDKILCSATVLLIPLAISPFSQSVLQGQWQIPCFLAHINQNKICIENNHTKKIHENALNKCLKDRIETIQEIGNKDIIFIVLLIAFAISPFFSTMLLT